MKMRQIHENAPNSWKYAEFMKIRQIYNNAPNSLKCVEFMKMRKVSENTLSLWKYAKFMKIPKVHENTQSLWKYAKFINIRKTYEKIWRVKVRNGMCRVSVKAISNFFHVVFGPLYESTKFHMYSYIIWKFSV